MHKRHRQGCGHVGRGERHPADKAGLPGALALRATATLVANDSVMHMAHRLLSLLLVTATVAFGPTCSKLSRDEEAIEAARLAFQRSGHDIQKYQLDVKTNAAERSWLVYFDTVENSVLGDTYAFKVSGSRSNWTVKEVVFTAERDQEEAIALARDLARQVLSQRGLRIDNYRASASTGMDIARGKWIVLFQNPTSLTVDTEVFIVVDNRTRRVTYKP